MRALSRFVIHLPWKPWLSVILCLGYLKIGISSACLFYREAWSWNTVGLKLFGQLKLSHGEQWLHGTADTGQVLRESCALPGDGVRQDTEGIADSTCVEEIEVTVYWVLCMRGFLMWIGSPCYQPSSNLHGAVFTSWHSPIQKLLTWLRLWYP